MSYSSKSTRTFDCPDCSFSSLTQAGLCCHRTKSHKANSSSAKSVYVVRSYPEGRNFACCLCGNTMLNYPNFKRHFQSVHPDTALRATFHCSICNTDLPNAQAASVHCKRAHGVSKSDPNFPHSPTPIMSCIDINASTTSDALSEASTCLGYRRSTRRTRRKQSSSVEQPILVPSVVQPSPPSYEATHDELTLGPAKQPEEQSNVNPRSLSDMPDQPEPNSSSLSGFMRECYNLPASYPIRPTQTVGLTSSAVGLTSSPVDDSSRFSPPASGPSPRRYQKDRTSHRRYQFPTTTDFSSSRSPRQSPPSSPPAVQDDVNDILFNSAMVNNEPTNELHPPTDNDNSPLRNEEENYTQSQPASSPTPSELTSKRDAFKDKWTTAFSCDIPWSEFCSLCDEFAVEARSLASEITANSSPTSNRRKPLPRCNRRTGRRPAFRHRPLLLNPAEAQRIQTLYRHSKKKAARKILSPNCSPYTGSIENAESFFKDTFSLRNCDTSSL